MTRRTAPFLSAVVIAQNNASTILRTITSVLAQDCPEPFEVILVDSGSDGTVELVRSKFPQVIVVDLRNPVLPGRARNEGLKIARGDYVSFPGSHVELLPRSLAARIEAHKKGYAMVTGSILNGTDTLAGWASYFIDHSAALPGRPSGPLNAPPNSCSYDRRVLIEHGLFPEDRRAGEDTVVNQRLWDAGHRAYRDNGIQLTHVTRCRTQWRLTRHHFDRGRAWGHILYERGRSLDDLDGYVRHRLDFIHDCVKRWGEELAARYHRARPLIRLGVASAWLGAHFELAAQRRGFAKDTSCAHAEQFIGNRRGGAETPTQR
jgi:glycosyltransferase involved in cell wall biosynthesis